MSVYSETPDKENSTAFYNNMPMRKNSGGLSGGAIAAIVICSIVALAIVAVIISLAKRSKPNEIDNVSRNSSTVNQIVANY